ncbi:MAG TPA: hypothetical protein VMU34_18045 [Mycobacterium sp.]|nr:hypothetical protein [Mycobacterium sp.]
MMLIADSGLWSTGPLVAPAPLVAVLEVSGAVLSWPVDEPSALGQITFTDAARADWLWRVVGESGHLALVAAVGGHAASEAAHIRLAEVELLPEAVQPLRRLAIGHWLRRWWPASARDGIPGLDHALLDAEIAVLTAAAQEFFADDTLDSDVEELLRPHAAALIAHVDQGDPRVVELVRACAELADDVGAGGIEWRELSAALDDPRRGGGGRGSRDEYALAAGSDAGRPAAAPIAAGVSSVRWAAVPTGVFDAADGTVDWRIEVADSAPVAAVRAAVIGPGHATGLAAHLQAGPVSAAGVLDAEGRATLPLVDAQQRPMTEAAAWNHDWSTTSVTIGADVEELPQTRARIRRLARARLEQPGPDAFLAEALAAESSY